MQPHSEPGTRLTRRTLLHGGGALAAFAGVSAMARQSEVEARAGAADVERFVETWIERAHALVEAEAPNEVGFLHELCAGISGVPVVSFPGPQRVVFEERGLRIGPVGGDAVFQMLEIEIEPGGVILPHNHVGYAFVSLARRGSVRARHFELLDDAPRPDVLDTNFGVREVSSTHMTPGCTSTLTRTWGNIHTFRAGEEGATLLDFGIQFPGPGDGPEVFSVLDIEDEARDARGRIHDARWLGNIYAK